MPLTWASSRRVDSGMTLIELLVVIAILSLLAGVFPLAIQRMTPARRLSAAAQILVTHIRDSQSHATLSGRPQQLTLDSIAAHGRHNDRVEITLKSDVNAQPIRALTLYPDGSSSGGTFELRVEQRLATVTVSALTGRAHVAQ